MRIGIIGDALDKQYAGIHYYTKNVIDCLVRLDKDNEYFVFRSIKKSNTDYNNIHVPLNSWIPGYQSYRLWVSIPRKARELNLDIVIEPAHFGPFNLPKHIKRVTVIHDLTPLLFREWHTFNGWFLQKLFLPGIIKRADLIITNSEYTKSDVVKYIGISPQKIVSSQLGISSIFKPTKDPLTLGKYGLYKEYILYQGTLEPRKNLVTLIKAYELYRDQFPQQKEQLILSGKKGWKIREILGLKFSSKYKDDIILLGYVDRDDMPIIYSSAAVFVYPSLYEGFGLPVLEAMACGTPIVTSNTSSLPEVGGRFAIYADPKNVDELAKAIAEARKNTDIQGAQITYAQSFTWQETAKNILEVIKTLK